MSNLVSLTRSSPWMLGKTQTEFFSISGYLLRCLVNKASHNLRTSYGIGIKFRQLSKFERYDDTRKV